MKRIEITLYCDALDVTADDLDRLERRLDDPEILWNVLEALEIDDFVAEATAEMEDLG